MYTTVMFECQDSTPKSVHSDSDRSSLDDDVDIMITICGPKSVYDKLSTTQQQSVTVSDVGITTVHRIPVDI